MIRFPSCLLLTLLPGTIAVAAETAPEYGEVQQIFEKYCTACHNPDDREGKLSMASFAELQQGGRRGPAFLAGASASSRMIRVLTGQSEPQMPPEGSEGPTEEEVQLLRAWIDQGAKGPQGKPPSARRLLAPQLESPEDLEKAVTDVAYAPDGKLIAVGQFGEVRLRDANQEQEVGAIRGLPGKVNAVHFSDDGRQLVVASGITGLYGQASVWNAADRTLVREFVGHRDILYDAQFSPDGRLLATCSYDQKILLWNVETGEVIRTLEGHNGAVYDLAFHPDGTLLASASGDETVKIWHLESGRRLDTLHQPQAEQYATTFSPDGKFVLAGGADNRIRVWRLVSRTRQRINPLVYARFAHDGAIVDLAFSRDGQSLVSVAEDRGIKIWETQSYTETRLLEPQPDSVTAVTVDRTGKRFAVGRMDGAVAQFPLDPGAKAPARPQDGRRDAAEPMIMPDAPTRTYAEQEPNGAPGEAMAVELPAEITGVVHAAGGQAEDVDLFRIQARAGESWMIETRAARDKSPLDSKVEVLDSEAQPVPRLLLQAMRDSYFTFRGQNSDTSDGFRLHNWQEMEVNEYLYAAGEVTRLWHYPRGPDSGFQLYPGRGKRFTFFDTTPTSHPVHAPCYIVEPHPPTAELIPNGLPVFPVYFENDDDPLRRFGADSRLMFTAPRDGEYLVRLSDSRGFSGADFKYALTIRPRRPDFQVTLGGANPQVPPGSGREFTVTAERKDGFEGAIRVEIGGLPPGFHATTPLIIEPGQTMAFGTINALPDAPPPTPENAKTTTVTATAEIHGETVEHEVSSFGEIKLGEKPKLRVELLPADVDGEVVVDPEKPFELVIAPGETVTAKVRVQRGDFKGRVGFGNADAGRNLPHGVYVDNIGLNGLLIVEGQSERTFYITAASWVEETTRPFHLRATSDGNEVAWPMLIHVRR